VLFATVECEVTLLPASCLQPVAVVDGPFHPLSLFPPNMPPSFHPQHAPPPLTAGPTCRLAPTAPGPACSSRAACSRAASSRRQYRCSVAASAAASLRTASCIWVHEYQMQRSRGRMGLVGEVM
jgi:hypothetical protein